jgi:YhcH/YjgK/YiaL family protein
MKSGNNMIVDKTDNLKQYAHLGSEFQKAFAFVTDPELMLLDNGKYEIDGDNVFALVSEYKTRDEIDGKFEAHKKYIDIQFLQKGTELIGYAPFKEQEIVTGYNQEKDIIFFTGEKSFIKMERGMFAVFFPYELHMPGIKSIIREDVKKIVVKVKA